MALDLLMEKEECKGVVAVNISQGTFHRLISKHTLIATGGYGQIYLNSTSPYSCTGKSYDFIGKRLRFPAQILPEDTCGQNTLQN